MEKKKEWHKGWAVRLLERGGGIRPLESASDFCDSNKGEE